MELIVGQQQGLSARTRALIDAYHVAAVPLLQQSEGLSRDMRILIARYVSAFRSER